MDFHIYILRSLLTNKRVEFYLSDEIRHSVFGSYQLMFIFTAVKLTYHKENTTPLPIDDYGVLHNNILCCSNIYLGDINII